jgi:hypothetical protein
MRFIPAVRKLLALTIVVQLVAAPAALAAPKVIVISLDGATPRLVDEYNAAGALDPASGLYGRLRWSRHVIDTVL